MQDVFIPGYQYHDRTVRARKSNDISCCMFLALFASHSIDKSKRNFEIVHMLSEEIDTRRGVNSLCVDSHLADDFDRMHSESTSSDGVMCPMVRETIRYIEMYLHTHELVANDQKLFNGNQLTTIIDMSLISVSQVDCVMLTSKMKR